MKKYLVLLVVVCGLVIPAAALAVDWDDRQNGDLVAAGADCAESDDGAWYHFVNNQTRGAAAGSITAYFVSPSSSDTKGPLAINRNVQHFYVFGEGTLDSASTNLPGTLVISGIACGKKNEDSPRDLFD